MSDQNQGGTPANPQTTINPPAAEPPHTSTTGWGFDAPDAGVGVETQTVTPAMADASLHEPGRNDPFAQSLPAMQDAGLPDVQTTDLPPNTNISGELDATPDRPTAEATFSPGTSR